jgi:hypothetical protein
MTPLTESPLQIGSILNELLEFSWGKLGMHMCWYPEEMRRVAGIDDCPAVF